MRVMKKVLALGIGALCVGTSVFAAELEWNYNGQAVAVGQNTPPPPPGCNSAEGDTSIAVTGNEVSVVFTNMHLQLDASVPALSGRKNCHIVIPTRIAKGYYLGRLDQKLNYSIHKTTGSTGLIQSRASFFEVPLGTLKVEAAATDSGVMEGTMNAASGAEFPVDAATWCKTYKDKAFEGNLIVDVSLDALRTDANQLINLSVDGRWRGIGEVYACPP
jgi:hypothetical protein